MGKSHLAPGRELLLLLVLINFQNIIPLENASSLRCAKYMNEGEESFCLFLESSKLAQGRSSLPSGPRVARRQMLGKPAFWFWASATITKCSTEAS